MTNNYEIKYFGRVSLEFCGADFGDARLNQRLMVMAEGLAANPSVSLPRGLGDGAGIEGGYRFLRNKRVSFDSILAPHIAQTATRAKLEKTVLVLHDGTDFKLSSDREGLGWLRNSKSKANGFSAHISLVVGASSTKRPLGVVSVETSVNTGKKKGYQSPAKRRADPKRKSLKWMRAVKTAEERLGRSVAAIHISDREADFFEYFSVLKDRGSRHVTRVCRDRLISDGFDDGVGLFHFLETQTVEVQREVPLGIRKRSPFPAQRKNHPARKQRMAVLSITAARVDLKRTHHNDPKLNPSILLNVVHVFEKNPPPGERGVDWKLFTTEAIETTEQIETIVDYYRSRWLIEEYNKAIKTGCSFEKRQLESKTTLLNALAIFVPIAWRMLLLRTEARQRPNAPAQIALTTTQIAVLRAVSKMPLPENPTVSQALDAIARLGGHLKQNGPPGWLILKRGLTDLLTMEKGWLAHQNI